jgi:hypothetical protein
MPTGGRSAPSTPDRKSADGANNDYFMGSPSYPTGSTRSLPTVNKGNISFNSRVSFHDVWSASEYDRRGDIATCNRLTPMLAQQIKEELNSFKMVCFYQSVFWNSVNNSTAGNGSSRRIKTTHALLLVAYIHEQARGCITLIDVWRTALGIGIELHIQRRSVRRFDCSGFGLQGNLYGKRGTIGVKVWSVE